MAATPDIPVRGAISAPRLPSHPAYAHDLGIYASDEEFAALVLPFALGALEAGEPIVFAYEETKTELLRSWLPGVADISYLADDGPYAAPAKALAAWRRVVEQQLDAGATRVRIAGDVPHPGYGRSYAGWDRYESALDRALGDLPVWGRCLYDARITPDDVLESATRLHREVVAPDGARVRNVAYELCTRLADYFAPELDPLEHTPPGLELVDPDPRTVRVAVTQATDALGSDCRADLVLTASEAVANAAAHGTPPVRVQIWPGEERVVVSVHDRGSGPLDPLAGLLPGAGPGIGGSPDASAANGREDACTATRTTGRASAGGGGRGLWLAHQLRIDVALVAAPDGFTVRLRAGGEL